MYRVHWGLREAPFRTNLDPRFFYQTPGLEEALARLHFLVDEQRRLGLSFSASGGGKTMLVEVLARQLRRSGRTVVNLSLLNIDLHEFLWLIAAELGNNPGRSETEFSLWRGILDRIVENRFQQLDTVMLLDDADEVEPPVLDCIARLCEADRSPAARLSIILTATTGNVRKLGQRLPDLAELRTDLEPWDEADTAGYLAFALRQAGRREPIFTDDATVRLCQLSDGVPRRLVQLANLSLLAGAGQSLSQIDAACVEDVFHELGVISVAG